MSQRFFGTDGLRGRVNVWPLTADMALRLGLAAGTLFRDGERRHTVIIGKDTRLSGYMFETALTAGLCAAGMDVFQVGPLPTPGHCLSHPQHAGRFRRGDFRFAQPLPR